MASGPRVGPDGLPVLRREVTTPDGVVWTVRRRWPSWTVTATRQGVYFYAAGVGRRESRRELDRITQAIEAGTFEGELPRLPPP